MKTLLAFLLCLPLLATAAPDPWDDTDVALGITAATAFAIDWKQTQVIAQNPTKWHELNPILGEHPTLRAVNQHFILNGLVIGGVAEYLPSTYRKWYLGSTAVVEAAFATHNYKIGLRFAF